MSSTPTDTAPRYSTSTPAVRVYALDNSAVLGLGEISRALHPDQARRVAAALTAAADGAEVTETVPRGRLRATAHPTPAGLIRVRIGAAALDLPEGRALHFADNIVDAAENCRDLLGTAHPDQGAE